jgi:hypothetical protein
MHKPYTLIIPINNSKNGTEHIIGEEVVEVGGEGEVLIDGPIDGARVKARDIPCRDDPFQLTRDC